MPGIAPLRRRSPLLTNDYINHFGALAMQIEMAPDFPDEIAELQGWQPRTYAEHVAAITFTDPTPLLHAYATLGEPLRGDFDATMCAANRHGLRFVQAIGNPSLGDAERRELCAYASAMMHNFIRRLTGIIAATQAGGALLHEQGAQALIDRMIAADEPADEPVRTSASSERK